MREFIGVLILLSNAVSYPTHSLYRVTDGIEITLILNQPFGVRQ